MADKQNSAAYPKDLQQRARVNERMDWFNTGLYRDLGYGLVYPQVIDAYRYSDLEVQSATLAHAREKAKKWLNILDANIIGGKTPSSAAALRRSQTISAPAWSLSAK